MSGRFQPHDAFKSPRFGQLATFMRLPHHREPKDLDVALVGIPYDGGTSYRPGARFGPREIRSQSALIRPWHPVLRVSPFDVLRVADYGDVDVSPISIERTNELVEARDRGDPGGGLHTGLDRRRPFDRAARSCARSRSAMDRSGSCISTRTRTPGTSTSARATSTAPCSGARSRRA